MLHIVHLTQHRFPRHATRIIAGLLLLFAIGLAVWAAMLVRAA